VLPLVTHVEYVPRAPAIKVGKDGTEGRTDGRQTDALRLPLHAASVKKA